MRWSHFFRVVNVSQIALTQIYFLAVNDFSSVKKTWYQYPFKVGLDENQKAIEF